MFKTFLMVITLIAAVAAPPLNRGTANSAGCQEQTTQETSASHPPVKVTIKTARNALSSATDSFHVGDQILVPITMTNTSKSPANVCISSDLYQDLPRLTRNDATVSTMKWQSRIEQIVKRDETCKKLNLPESVELNPNEPNMVDWLVLVDSKVPTGADAWYDSLPPGKYELSIQRRIECCDGPRVQSNTVRFEVLP